MKPRLFPAFPPASSPSFFRKLRPYQLKVSLRSCSTNHIPFETQRKMSANVSNLEAVHHAFNTLITSLTPAQMSNFAQQLRTAATATTRVTRAKSTPQPDQYGLMTPASSSPVRRDKRAARAKIKEARAERSKLRPLNAFMAFRCKFLQSWEKGYSADSINSILLIAASWFDAEDEVRSHP
jgi:hypothetical protein